MHALTCRAYWGSHGCCLPPGHEGPHRCACADWPGWETDEEADNVGAPPFYGPGTRFYGEDA